MGAIAVREIYERHIKPIPAADRLQLLALLAQDLAAQASALADQPGLDIMQFHGLGRALATGVDAQEFVNRLRGEWDHRP